MSTTHPGLNFRRSFAAPTSNKTSPAISQHASPYQHPAYPPPQAQAAPFPQHLFSSPAPSPVQNIQNGARQLPPQQAQRATPRQMQPHQPPQLNYLQQTLNHQSQTLNHQSMNHNHQVRQTPPDSILSQQPQQQQSQSQPPLPQQQQPQQQVQQQVPQLSQVSQNHQVQQVPQMPPLPQVQQVQQVPQVQQLPQVQQVQHVPQLPQVQQVSQMPQVQQVPQVTQVQQTSQVQQLPQLHQQPTTQAEPAAQHKENRHDGDMELDSPGDDADGHADPADPKAASNSFIAREPMGMPMSAPPEGGSYASLEAVHKHVLEYCTSVGYAVVIGRSKKTVPGLKKVLFVCDRAGKPPKRVSPEMRKRKTSSRKCDCQFGFFAIEQRTQWTIRYRPDSNHLQHNHGPSESPLHHPAARKLDNKMIAAVKNLKDSGIGVSQTLEILQNQNPHVPLLPRDIYNARAAINRNPQKVASGIAEDRPAIYSKPHPTAEERIRTDLRREIQQVKTDYDKLKEESAKEIAKLKEELQKKDKMIHKFEQFIDICNQRVMVARDSLFDNSEENSTNGANGSAAT